MLKKPRMLSIRGVMMQMCVVRVFLGGNAAMWLKRCLIKLPRLGTGKARRQLDEVDRDAQLFI
jgi:hypothetical protein